MRVPNPVGSAQPATSVAGPSFAGRSGHDGGTFAATPRRTAALRPPEPPTEPPPTKPRPPSAAASASAVAVVAPPPPWSKVSQRSNWVAGANAKCRVRHYPFVKHLLHVLCLVFLCVHCEVLGSM